MNINKFTQKSMEAVQNCEKLAYEYGNQQIEQEHLFYTHAAGGWTDSEAVDKDGNQQRADYE